MCAHNTNTATVVERLIALGIGLDDLETDPEVDKAIARLDLGSEIILRGAPAPGEVSQHGNNQ
jgi:hypothetical protein